MTIIGTRWLGAWILTVGLGVGLGGGIASRDAQAESQPCALAQWPAERLRLDATETLLRELRKDQLLYQVQEHETETDQPEPGIVRVFFKYRLSGCPDVQEGLIKYGCREDGRILRLSALVVECQAPQGAKSVRKQEELLSAR